MTGLTPIQSRIARAALAWSQAHLAELSGMDRRRIHRFEMGTRVYDHEIVAQHIRQLFESAGIEFRKDSISYQRELTN